MKGLVTLSNVLSPKRQKVAHGVAVNFASSESNLGVQLEGNWKARLTFADCE